MGQHPTHHAIWIREKPDGVPPANACQALRAAWGSATVMGLVPEALRAHEDTGSALERDWDIGLQCLV